MQAPVRARNSYCTAIGQCSRISTSQAWISLATPANSNACISPAALDDMFSSPLLIAALQMNPVGKVSVVQAMRSLPHRSLGWRLADYTILLWSTKITPVLLSTFCTAEPCDS
jgi:hypothetical protein